MNGRLASLSSPRRRGPSSLLVWIPAFAGMTAFLSATALGVTILALLATAGRAQETGGGLAAAFYDLNVSPKKLTAGQSVTLSATLENDSSAAWPAGMLGAAVVMTQEGRELRRTEPIPVRSEIAAGESKPLRLQVVVPESAAGKVSFKIVLLKGKKTVFESWNVAADVAGVMKAAPAPAARAPSPAPAPASAPPPESRPAAAPSQDYDGALRAFRPFLNPAAFNGASYSPSGTLILSANEGYAKANGRKQKELVLAAAKAWRAALEKAGFHSEQFLVSVYAPGQDQLWGFDRGAVVKEDELSDLSRPYAGERDDPVLRAGRLFAYVGGQYFSGQSYDVKGVNGRLGTTLFHDRYDVAATFAYSSFGNSQTVQSYGVIGRALFPITRKVGWNVGLELERDYFPGLTTENNVSGVLGLNFYLPRGSLDLTGQIGTHNIAGVLLGYTIYLTKH